MKLKQKNHRLKCVHNQKNAKKTSPILIFFNKNVLFIVNQYLFYSR